MPTSRMHAGQKVLLDRLARQIETIQHHAPAGVDDSGDSSTSALLQTGWRDPGPTGSNPIAALHWSAVHEWFTPANVGSNRRGRWVAPVSLFLHLAGQALRSDRAKGGRCIIWIGAACWWYPRARLGAERSISRALFERSIFVDPADDAQRLWAIDLALRCPGVLLVAADGRKVRMPESRRLQLAAAAGSAIALLARPVCEMNELSAARSRWLVAPAPPDGHVHSNQPRWTVQLLRYKGMQPASRQEARPQWTVQRNHETGAVDCLPDAPRPGTAKTRPAIIRRIQRIA